MSDAMRPAEPSCDDVRESAGAFVLGALEPAEEAAIRAHLETCDDAHAEIAELGSVLPILDASVPMVEPSAGLKGRIMAAAAADLAGRGTSAPAALVAPTEAIAPTQPEVRAEATAPSAPIPFPSAEERTARSARAGSRTWALRIAAVLAIAVLGGWNVLLQNQLGQSQTYERSVAQVLDVAGQPGSVTAVLTAKGPSRAAGLAAVASDGTVSMAIRDLAPTTGTQVYEAWVIGPDKVPVALGGFTVGNDGVAHVQMIGVTAVAGNTLALTLEPVPGATAPGGPVVSAGATAG
jgi:anti-sigma-K factor RskA